MNRYFLPGKSGKPPKASADALKLWNEKGGSALHTLIVLCKFTEVTKSRRCCWHPVATFRSWRSR